MTLAMNLLGLGSNASVAGGVSRFPTRLPVGNLAAPGGGTWQQIFADDFTTYPDLAVGSFVPQASGVLRTDCAAYPHMGANWTFYPDGGNTTWGGDTLPILSNEPGYIQPGQPGYPAMHPTLNSKYYPSKTLSVVSLGGGEKALQVNQHIETLADVDTELGANMKPVNPGGTYKFDPYYRVQYMMAATEVVTNGVDQAAINDFVGGTDNRRHSVPLGIDSSNWPGNGEIDWWEGSSNRRRRGNYHPAWTSNQTYPVDSGESPYQYHLATVEWSPGLMQWFTNSDMRLNTTDRVPTGPMAWQFQHEMDWRQAPPGYSITRIKWVSLWKYVP